jgi:hypothetical protein
VPGWPKGTWITWGHLKTWDPKRPYPQVVPQVTVNTPTSGVSLTDEKLPDGTNSVATFTFSRELSPGEPVTITAGDKTGYTSTAQLVVSSDGCLLKGYFSDTNGNSGTLNYLWERPEYFVRP